MKPDSTREIVKIYEEGKYHLIVFFEPCAEKVLRHHAIFLNSPHKKRLFISIRSIRSRK